MAKIKYEKYNGRFLITEFTDKNSQILDISFPDVERAKLTLGSNIFPIENGKAYVSISELSERRYVPILTTDTESFLCDRINILAGRVSLDLCERERLFYLSSELIRTEKELSLLKQETKRLCKSVYGKNIF
jgi:hypothetical protein